MTIMTSNIFIPDTSRLSLCTSSGNLTEARIYIGKYVCVHPGSKEVLYSWLIMCLIIVKDVYMVLVDSRDGRYQRKLIRYDTEYMDCVLIRYNTILLLPPTGTLIHKPHQNLCA